MFCVVVVVVRFCFHRPAFHFQSPLFQGGIKTYLTPPESSKMFFIFNFMESNESQQLSQWSDSIRRIDIALIYMADSPCPLSTPFHFCWCFSLSCRASSLPNIQRKGILLILWRKKIVELTMTAPPKEMWEGNDGRENDSSDTLAMRRNMLQFTKNPQGRSTTFADSFSCYRRLTRFLNRTDSVLVAAKEN